MAYGHPYVILGSGIQGVFPQTMRPEILALSARSADGLMRSSVTRQPKPFMLPFNLRNGDRKSEANARPTKIAG
jgi:hypothetical protein